MSTNSPIPGRILRSHAKKPEENSSNNNNKNNNNSGGNNKEKDVKNPQLTPESEKDKKKRKAKPSSSSQSVDDSHHDAHELDVNKFNKPGKKKRKINTRTAHSDGEQDYVELGSKSKAVIGKKGSKDGDSVPTGEIKLPHNIMEPILALRSTLSTVLAKLPKPPPSAFNYNSPFVSSEMAAALMPLAGSPPSSNANANTPLSFGMLNMNKGLTPGNTSSTFTPDKNNNNNASESGSLFSTPTHPTGPAAQSQQTAGAQQGNFWGSLMSQYPHHPNIPLSGSSYSIGRRTSRCNLALPDDFLSTTLCKIHYSNGVATIESCSGSSSLQLNNQPIRKGYTLVLRSGDELSFTGSKHYSFIFQLYNTTNTSATPNSSLPSSANTTTTTSTTATPVPASSSTVPSTSVPNPASANATATGNGNPFSFLDVEKSLIPEASSFAKNPTRFVDTYGVDPPLIIESEESNEMSDGPYLPPLLPSATSTPSKAANTAASSDTTFITPQKPAPSASRADVTSPLPFPLPSASASASSSSSSSTTTTTTTTTSSAPVAPQEQNTLKETFKAEIRDLTLLPNQITFSLDDFPYYLAKDTKQMLVSAAFLFLTKPEYVKYTSDLPSVSRRILLEGPAGTDLYQETLVKAVAKQFNAQLIMLDHTYFETKEKAPAATGGPTSLSASTPLLSSTTTPSSSSLSSSLPSLGSRSGMPDLVTEDDDADYSSEEYSRRLTAFDVSKRRFKIDDRVKYTGPSPSSFVMNRHHSTASSSSSSTLHAGTAPSSSSSDPASSRLSPHRGPQIGNKGKVVITFDDNPRRVGVRFDKSIAGGVDLGGLCEESHGFFVDTSEIKRESDSADDRPDALAITGLFEMLATTTTPTILCIKDAEKVLLANYERYAHIKREFTRINKLPVPVLIIGNNIARAKATASASGESARRVDKGHGSGLLFSKATNHHTAALLDLSFFDHISRIEERAKETSKTTKFLYKMLSNKIVIAPPKDPATLSVWREKLEKDVEQIKSETNQANLRKALEKSNLECTNLASTLLRKQVFTPDNVEKIIGWAVSHHLMTEGPTAMTLSDSNPATPPPATPPPASAVTPSTPANTTTSSATKIEKLEIGLKSIDYAIEMLTSNDPDTKAVKSLKDVETENEFEKRILSEVIPPHEIAIRFEDIGALGKVKETLKELVMLPLQRPELFRKGNLTKPCKGILLFGPPGTGKTMLAKAVATESGANFINVSMSTIGSKWFGEGEKYAKAVFTLAGKIAPSVIFIDEVDSILGKRDRSGEHEAMRKIKNEFMSMWDGLRSRDGERVLVLAATNRPFDLDDAVLRRLSRRLMVDLPDQENRTKILQVILAKEDLEPGVDFNALASMTEGYSGSDLKNLSIAAAYQPIREFLRQERLNKQAATANGEASTEAADLQVSKDKLGVTGEVVLRAITMGDFVKAKDEVSPSVSEDAFSIAELRKWNDMYGEGGSRVKSTLTYFV